MCRSTKLEKGYQPNLGNKGYQPCKPQIIETDRPKPKSGYQPPTSKEGDQSRPPPKEE